MTRVAIIILAQYGNYLTLFQTIKLNQSGFSLTGGVVTLFIISNVCRHYSPFFLNHNQSLPGLRPCEADVRTKAVLSKAAWQRNLSERLTLVNLAAL